MTIYEDNQACIKVSETKKTKTTEVCHIKHNFVRDLIETNKIKLEYIASCNQLLIF